MSEHENTPLRDVFCQQSVKDGSNFVIGGDVYVGAENNYRPIRNWLTVDQSGLFRLQREIAEAIERLAREAIMKEQKCKEQK